MTTETTAELVRRAREGQASAFAPLVERFQDMAVGYALGRVTHREGALDAAQEAFTEAYLRLDQLREDAAFPGWLRRIVHKHCDRQTRRFQPVLTEVSDELIGERVSPEERLDAAEAATWLRSAIEALPEHERLVVALHYLGETAQNEVAEFLELPLSTVKKRLFTARGRIRTWRMTMDTEQTVATRPSATPTFGDQIQLFLAIRSNDSEAVRRILTRRPALVDAEEAWTEDEALAGGIPLAHRQTPLILAAGRRDLQMVRLLLERGASPNGLCGCANAETALWAAVRAGSTEVAEALLGAGADPNARNANGHTSLHVAAMQGRAGLLRLLLAHGASEAEGPNGLTPADWAAAHDHAEAWTALTRRPLERAPRPTPARDTSIETGIKVLDLFVPLRRGNIVRVHGAAETGLLVLLSELARRFADGGGASVWATWEVEPWQADELSSVAAQAGVEGVVDIVKGGRHRDRLEPGRAAPRVMERAAAKAATLRQHHDVVALFVFEAEGHNAEVDAALPRLREHADLVFVISPWMAVTKGEIATPKPQAPYDAVICTDPRLARAGIYPAVSPLLSGASGPAPSPHHQHTTEEARALLSGGGERASLVESFLSQPFYVAEPQTGWMAETVLLEEALTSLERILRGDFDALPQERLRYQGRLPDDPAELVPRAVDWS